ncbi:MAG: hypothetical protein HYZ24_10410 [Chloroflexi bacterium]|nr:hypothetical protein [Chloroflexota bacterium]
MKKSILFFVVFILTACASAPQVTVMAPSAITVTLTPPIPTPTLHPEFAALQQTIADSGSRFTLGADGLLYDGETPIPGITVSPDGAMTLTVNGETVTLDPADVDFDDEKGITIDGYEWDEEAGAWVEAESPAMQQTNALLEQYHIDQGTVTVTEKDGIVTITDNETEKVLMINTEEGTRYDLEFAVDQIAAKSCEAKPEFKPDQSGRIATGNRAFRDYLSDIRDEFGYNFNGLKTFNILLDREKPCWGSTDGKYLFYRDEDGVAIKLALIPVEEAKILEFLFSR